MNILCYAIVTLLFLLALYADILSLVVNVKRLVIPTYKVSGIPVFAVILYILIGGVFRLFDKQPPSLFGKVLLFLVLFHILVHIAIPVFGHIKTKD